VIYRVIKYVNSPTDRTADTIKVMFSEKIFNPNGTSFFITNPPPQTFIAWWAATGTDLADSLLEGIPSFIRVVDDSVLYFAMSNGKYITSNNWMNIRASSRFLRDGIGNYPADNNRRVRLEVETILIINTFPNPSGVTIRRIPSDSIHIENVLPGGKSVVKQWVTSDRAGTVISLGGIQKPLTGEPVNLILKIYDVVGNLVTWTDDPNIFKQDQAPMEVNLYWNGMNKMGMGVAPGVYRATIFINYPPQSEIKDIKTMTTVGITN
jgi:hypothetical protein